MVLLIEADILSLLQLCRDFSEISQRLYNVTVITVLIYMFRNVPTCSYLL